MNKARYQAIFNSENQNWWYKGRRKLLIEVMNSLKLNINKEKAQGESKIVGSLSNFVRLPFFLKIFHSSDMAGGRSGGSPVEYPQRVFSSEDIGRNELLTGPARAVKILDIGCGTGRNLMLLKNFGETFGVDISPEAINFCKQRNLKNVSLIKSNEYNFPDNYFDLITCLDILEHVNNEKEILSEIKRVLKKDGHVIFFVPASPRIWSKLDTDSHHKRRYTKEALTRVLKKNSFHINNIKYFNYLLYLPMFLVRLFQKTSFGKNNTYGVRPDSESVLVNKLLEPIFTLDIKSLKFFSPPFGVSLYTICKKSN